MSSELGAEKYIKSGLQNIIKIYYDFCGKSKQGLSNSQEYDAPIPEMSSFSKTLFGKKSPKNPSGPKTNSILSDVNDEIDIEKELKYFRECLNKTDPSRLVNTIIFWDKHKEHMPKLHHLTTILSNIPATSASLERYFSITGLICDKRRMRMTAKCIIMRCMIKVNLHLMVEINEIGS